MIAVVGRLLRSVWMRWPWRGVPVRMQLTNAECGVACLAMVLSYHGRHTTIAQLRSTCGSVRGGVSARQIVEAARLHGMRARGLRADRRLVGRVALPAVAHWRGDHFVVVERWARRHVEIVDPAWGRRRVSTADFVASVGSVVLAFEPGPDFTPAARTEPSGARILAQRMAKAPGVVGLVGQVLLTTVVLQLFGVTLPVATKLIVDEVLAETTRDGLVTLLGMALVVCVAAQAVADYLRSLLLILLQGRLDWNVLTGFVDHLYRLPLRYFHERTTSDLALRLASIGVLRNLLANQTMTSMLDGLLLVTYVVLMFVFDPVLASAVLVVLVLQALATALVTGRSRDLTARNVLAQVRVQEYLLQSLGGIGTIKAAGAERHVVSRLQDRFVTWTSTALQRSQLDAGLDTFAGTLSMLTPLMVLWLGISRVLDGAITVGTLLGFVWISAAVLTPLSTLVLNWQRLQTAVVQLERLGDVLRAAPEPRGSHVPPAADPAGSVLEIRDVSFRYDDHGPPAVDAVSAVIAAGQRVAVVGRSGAGKTTLAMLLLGLYQPTSGAVLYDGVPLTDLDLPTLRRRFAAVLQEPFTMRGTVRENITLTHPQADDEDVRRAARIAEVDEDVRRLPLGYDTPLAEHGVGLSGGQLQRLSIARALVGRPSLLIFDEATSHLDAETEQRIVANLRGVACTQVVIAHRLSTIRDADLILVIDGGRLVESGAHRELVKRRGIYARLVDAQLGPLEPDVTASTACVPTDPDPAAGVGGSAARSQA